MSFVYFALLPQAEKRLALCRSTLALPTSESPMDFTAQNTPNSALILGTPYLIRLPRTFGAWFAFAEKPAQLGFEVLDEAWAAQPLACSFVTRNSARRRSSLSRCGFS